MRFLAHLRHAYKITHLTYPRKNALSYASVAVDGDQFHNRCYGSKASGNSKFFKSKKIARKHPLDKYKYGSISKRRSSRPSASITPVAVMSNADLCHKVALIPIHLFEGKHNDEEAFQDALAVLSMLKDNGNQVELFSDVCTKLKLGDRGGGGGGGVLPDDANIAIPPPDRERTPFLTEFEKPDEAYLRLDDNHQEEETNKSQDFDEHIADASLTTKTGAIENKVNDISFGLPSKIASEFKEIPVSGMQLNFEMDMTNVRDALLNPNNIPKFKVKSEIGDSKLALTTNVRVDPKETTTIPLHFNAVIQGTVDVNPKEFTGDKLNNLKVPEFNEYVTAVAANLCSTALKKGFPTDVCRKEYSTRKMSETPKEPKMDNILERYDRFKGKLKKRDKSICTEGPLKDEAVTKLLKRYDGFKSKSLLNKKPGKGSANPLGLNAISVTDRAFNGAKKTHVGRRRARAVAAREDDKVSDNEPVIKLYDRYEKMKAKDLAAKEAGNDNTSALGLTGVSVGEVANASKKKPTDRKRSPHIVCVKEDNKGCTSPGLAANKPFVPKKGGEVKKSKSKTSSLQQFGLLDCKLYKNSLEEAECRRKEFAAAAAAAKCKAKSESEAKCGSSKRSSSSKCGSKSGSKDTCKKSASASKCGSKSSSKDTCKKSASASKCGGSGKSGGGKDPCKKSSGSSKCGSGSKSSKSASKCGSGSKDAKKKSSSSKCGAPKKSSSTSKCGSKSSSKDPCKKSASASKCGSKSSSKDTCKKSASATKCGGSGKSGGSKDPCKKSSGTSKCGSSKSSKSASKCSSSKQSKKPVASKCAKKSASAPKCGSKSQSKDTCKKSASTSKCGSSGAKKSSSASKCGSGSKPTKKSSSSKCGAPKKCASDSKSGSKSKSKDTCKKSASASKCGAKKSSSGSKCASKSDSKSKCGSSSSKTDACKKASSGSKSKCGSKKESGSKSKCGSKKQDPCKKSSSASTCGSKSASQSSCKKSSSAASKCGAAASKSKCQTKSKCGSKGKDPPPAADSVKACKRSAKAKCGGASKDLCNSSSQSKCPSEKKKPKLKCGRPPTGDTKPKCKKSVTAKSSASSCGSKSSKSSVSSKSSTKKKAPAKPGSKSASSKSSPKSKLAAKKKAVAKKSSSASTVASKSSKSKSRSSSASSGSSKGSSKKNPKGGKPSGSCGYKRGLHTIASLPLPTPFTVKLNTSSCYILVRDFSDKKDKCDKGPKGPYLSERSDEYRKTRCEKYSWKDNKYRKKLKEKPKNCYPDETSEFCPNTSCFKIMVKKEKEAKRKREERQQEKKPKENKIVNDKALCTKNMVTKWNRPLLIPSCFCGLQVCHNSSSVTTNQEAVIREPYKICTGCPALPRIVDNDVLVRVDAVALCDSDIYMFETGARNYPSITLGNEAAGVVEKVGKNVARMKPGDHVVIESGLPCGKCSLCIEGHYNLCNQMDFKGCLTKYLAHPASFCHKIIKAVPVEHGALVYQLALGCNACYKAGIRPNSNVAIIGSCTMTVCAAMCAQCMGAENVCVLCSMPDTEDVVQEFVTDKVAYFDCNTKEKDVVEIMTCLLGTAPDIIINCSSCTKTMNTAIMALRPAGTCIIAGFVSECAAFNLIDALTKEIRIVQSFRSNNMFPLAISLLETGRVPIDCILADCRRWDELEGAFKAALTEANIGPRRIVVHCQVGDASGKVKG